MTLEKQLPEVPVRKSDEFRVQKTVVIHFAPRSLGGRIVAVALSIFIVILGFFFLATAIALAGILVAIGIGWLLWNSRRHDSR